MRAKWRRGAFQRLSPAFASLCAGLVCAGQTLAATLPLTPAPLDWSPAPGVARLPEGAPITIPAGDAGAAAAARELIALERRTGGPVFASRRSGASGAASIVFRRGEPGALQGPEAYVLDVGPAGAVVTARGDAGLFHGAVSLWQLIEAARRDHGAVLLDGVHIEDAPRFPWRGLMLDSARHFQSVAEIERLIDAMAVHKLNRLQWHLTDDQAWRLEIKRYPRLARIGGWRAADPLLVGQGGVYGGVYSQADVRRLVAYAAARQVTIVPEIEMPGHALAAILAEPRLGLHAGLTAANRGDWGIFPSIYNVDDRSFELLEGVLTEVMELFPSPYIHIGGDEAVTETWLASPTVRAKMLALGVTTGPALQSWFVRRIGVFLNAHGRRLIGWDDILAGGDLPAMDAVTSWHAGSSDATRSGHDVVVATAPTLYFDNRQSGDPAEPPGRGEIVTLGDVYRLDPPDGPHVLGLQANIWTEHVRTDARLEAMVFPRLAAVAESGWTAQTRRSWPDFVSRLPGLMAIYRALGLRPDESALAVRAVQAPGADGKSVTVTLANQAALGDIRYTIDGSPPSALSATYRAAITLPLPRRLRAGAFLRDERISPLLDLPLDQASVVRRASQDLKLCSDKLDLNLEGAGASSGERPVILIDILNPCWIYAGADLSEGRALLVGVGTVPFHYQLGDDLADIELRAPATAAGELVARMDRCDGEILAVLPLAGARPNAGVSELRALLPPRAGRHDICLTFTARRLDPMWAVSWAAVETAPPLRSASQ